MSPFFCATLVRGVLSLLPVCSSLAPWREPRASAISVCAGRLCLLLLLTDCSKRHVNFGSEGKKKDFVCMRTQMKLRRT
jgi:hypothetical protein